MRPLEERKRRFPEKEGGLLGLGTAKEKRKGFRQLMSATKISEVSL